MLRAAPGTYAIVFECARDDTRAIGQLGRFKIPEGFYVYVGSALGPGGVDARVRRHCRASKRLRWHVDYLSRSMPVPEVWYTYDSERREHHWTETMIDLGYVPYIEGFGSSDCRCYSHLFRAHSRPSSESFRKAAARKFPAHERIGVWNPPLSGLESNRARSP